MDLKMEVYAAGLELVGILEVHRSVIWEETAFGAGSFSVDALITDESLSLLIPENIIWIEGDTAGIIEYVHEEIRKDGPYLNVKGFTLTGILERRILWGRYQFNAAPPAIMHQLVNDCCVNPTRGNAAARKIPGLVLLDPAPGGDSIRLQKTGGSLLEALEQIGAAYGVAFGVRFNPEVPQMEFWTRWGKNRSVGQTTNDPVFYSTELDDVLTSEYSYNAQDYRNVALVAGEDSGDDRVMVTVEEQLPDVPAPPTPAQYTITLAVDPQGGGTAAGGGTVAADQSVTVTAASASGYTFSAWTENGAVVSTSAAYTFTASADRALTAVFTEAAPVYTITASISPEGGGTVKGTGQYQEGAQVTVTATPGEGYEFAAWKETGAPKLPTGYAEVEYIQSSGTQYIDTGFKPNNNTRLSAEFAMTTTSRSLYCLGANDGTNFFRMFSQSGGSGIQNFYGTSNRVLTANISEKTYVEQNKNVAIAGDNIYTFQQAEFSIDYNIFLFTDNTSGAANTSRPASMRLYTCQIYDNGTLARSFVPCSDPFGTVGLYDLVGGAFYANAGTGAFIAGPGVSADTTVSEDAEYTFTVTGNRALVAAFEEKPASRLPDGYIEAEYIQSAGKGYFSTGQIVYSDTITTMDVEPLAVDSGAKNFFAASDMATSSSIYYYYRLMWSSVGITGSLGAYRTSWTQSESVDSNAVLRRMSLVLNGETKQAYVDGVLRKTFSDNTVGSSKYYKLNLLGGLTCKLYSCQIKRNTTLQHDYVPCTNPSGAVGLYDLVGKSFLAPSTSDGFAAGPAVQGG